MPENDLPHCSRTCRVSKATRHSIRRIAKSLGTQASSLREGCGMESPPCAGRMPTNSLAFYAVKAQEDGT